MMQPSAGPEIVCMLNEFESCLFLFESPQRRKHHQQTECAQVRFKTDVNVLLDVFEDEPIISETTGNDLIVLGSNTFADQSVLKTVKTAEQLGRAEFGSFFSERLNNPGVISVLSPISRNKLSFFSFGPVSKKNDASSLKVSSPKTD
jgi:hypothetical protein